MQQIIFKASNILKEAAQRLPSSLLTSMTAPVILQKKRQQKGIPVTHMTRTTN